MQKIIKICLVFSLFGLTGCASAWPDELKGTKFEPVNKMIQQEDTK